MTQHSNDTSTRTTDPKVAVVQRLYEAVGRNDLDTILDALADDVDWAADAAGTSVPWYGTFHGKEEVPGFFKELGANIEITEFTPLSYASNDTDVMVPVRWSYTVTATGRTASMVMQHLWRFVDGKVVGFRGAEDSEQSAAAFDIGGSNRGSGDGDGALPGASELAAVPAPEVANVALIQSLYGAVGRGDLAAVLDALADDVDWASEAPSSSAPWYGRYRGAAEVPAFFRRMGESIDIVEMVPLSFTANDDEVMVLLRWRFTSKATGRTVAGHLHHWWRIADGRIVFYRGLDDSRLTASAFA
jgi:uncharacterized protein